MTVPRRRSRSGVAARAAEIARLLLAGAALVHAGCATASRPPATAVARDVGPGAAGALRGARTVWLAGAISRTGSVAAGVEEASAGAPGAVPGSADASDELERAVRRTRGLELAPTRDAADLVLYFEQADRLRCWGCRQPDDLWHWWGLVADRGGHPVATLHGESAEGPDGAALQFVQAVKSLTRR